MKASQIAKAQGKYKGRQPIPIDVERFKAECQIGEQDSRPQKQIHEENGNETKPLLQKSQGIGLVMSVSYCKF